MRQLESTIFTIIGFVMVVGAFSGALGLAIDRLPEPAPVNEITCAYRENCHVQVFQVSEGRKAYCAIWGRRESVCKIDRDTDR